ncbi:MAG: holo-ACP synthase [Panacagrimonas sp.]
MIYGIGTDLIRVDRIEAVFNAHERRFVAKLLHPEELAQFSNASNPANFLAKSWAVKEAFGKALGTGVRGYANPDVGVVRGELGRPHLVYSEAMRHRLDDRGVGGGHVSLTDEGKWVMAFVVLEHRQAS